MPPKIEISLFDGTVFYLQLPPPKRSIAILVSGGLDSALLYYLLKFLSLQDNRYSVTPYTLERTDYSRKHAQQVVDYVHDVLGCARKATTFVPISNKDANLQVAEGIMRLLKEHRHILYIGYIKTLPEHALHGVPAPFVPIDGEIVKHPLKELTKAHVVDLGIKLGIEKVFEITHSCVYEIDGGCNICNRCIERAWAFKQLSLADPNTH